MRECSLLVQWRNVGQAQCDQIRRNFATLARHYKTWAILKGFINYLAKF